MSFFIKELVRKKLKQITPDELFSYAKEYGFSISLEQAIQISNYLKNSNADPFKRHEREKMFRDLAKITNNETANAAKVLLNEVIRSYGLEHLFE